MNDQRPEFEAWLLKEQGLDAEWQADRNCYKEFAAHLAYKAWLEAQKPLAKNAERWQQFRDVHAEYDHCIKRNDHTVLTCMAIFSWREKFHANAAKIGPDQLDVAMDAAIKDRNDKQE